MNLFEKLESKCYNFIHIKLLLIRSVCLFPALAGPDQCWLSGQVESPESQQDPGAAQSAHLAVGPLRCLLQVVLATQPAVCSRHLEQTGCRKHSRLGELGHLLLFLLLFLFFFPGWMSYKVRRVSALSPSPQKLSLPIRHLCKSLRFPGALQSMQGSPCCGNFTTAVSASQLTPNRGPHCSAESSPSSLSLLSHCA